MSCGHEREAGHMTKVERNGSDFVVATPVLGEAFGLAEDEVRKAMHDAALTSRCEAGQEADEGCWRLSFRYKDRVFRLTLDAAWKALTSASFAAPRPPHDRG